MTSLLFELQAFSTFAMTGLIWFVQVVHYPLFAWIPGPQQQGYAEEHQRRTGWVVGPLMLMELTTSLLTLLPVFRPADVNQWQAFAGAALVAIIWASTAILQIPIHRQLLLTGNDAQVIRRLVLTNWIRTLAWSARSGLLLTSILSPRS